MTASGLLVARKPKATLPRRSKSTTDRKEFTPQEVEQLAALSKHVDFVPEWREITKTYSVPELIQMVRKVNRPKRSQGRPPKPDTAVVIEAEAQRLYLGGHRTQYSVSQQFWKSLAPPKRYDRYRSCVSNNERKISARLKELKKAQNRRPNTTV